MDNANDHIRLGAATNPRTYSLRDLKLGDCLSSVPSRGYADFYIISVGVTTIVTIEMESSNIDTHLYLRRGEGEQSATATASHDDINFPNDTNSRIVKTLTAGKYTIEATLPTSQIRGATL